MLVFAIAGALRLARFNVMIDDPDKPAWAGKFFTGMPAPAGAVTVLLPLYVQTALNLQLTRAMAAWEIVYVLVIALLMASRIPHYSGKTIGRVPREYFIFVLFGVAAFLVLLATFPVELLIFLSLAYLSLIPFSARAYKRLAAADEARKTAAGPTAPET